MKQLGQEKGYKKGSCAIAQSYNRGLPKGTKKFLGMQTQSGQKKKQCDADMGNSFYELRVLDQADTQRPQDNATNNIADNNRLPQKNREERKNRSPHHQYAQINDESFHRAPLM